MSINQLAKELNLSQSTVYRALSQPGLVSKEVLEAIHAAARSMQIDLQKRSPRGRPPKADRKDSHLKKLGVWFIGSNQTYANRFLSTQIALVRIACEEAGMAHQFIFSSSIDELPVEISQQKVDAVLMEGLLPSKEAIGQMGRIPSVWIMTRRSEDYPDDFVEPDNTANGRMAADYLQKRGNQHVAFVTTEPDYPAFAQRKTSFLNRCKQLGMNAYCVTRLSQSGREHLQHPPSDEVGEELAKELIASDPDLKGIYIPSEHAVGALYRGLRRVGKNAACFDWILGNYDPYVWQQLDPQPAAIDINLSTIISQAVQISSWRIRHPEVAARIGIAVGPTLLKPGTQTRVA